MKKVLKKFRKPLIALVAGLIALSSAAVLLAATIGVNDTTIDPGQTVTVSGTCNIPDFISVDFDPTGSTPGSSGNPQVLDFTDAFGVWSIMYTVPGSTAPGSYDFYVFCIGGSDDARTTVQVNGPAAVGGTGGAGGGGSTTGTPTCDTPAPSPASDLFQINTTSTSMTLYFTPNNGNASYYLASYGFSLGDERFGGILDKTGKSNMGVQEFTISDLAPSTTYFVHVRAQDGCRPGSWSNTMKITTDGTTYFHYDANHNEIPLIP